MSLLTEASLVILPNAVEEGTLFSIIPTDGSGDLTVVRATTATEVNSSGVIVDVASNVARLDYTNGSCPCILVEPQRTNLALNSQSFIPSWSTSPQTTGTITSTTTIDPEGFTNAVRITNVSGGGTLGRVFTVVPGTTYTSSIWVRRVTGIGIVELVDLNGGSISLNLTNEWQRFSVTSTAVSIGRFYIRATIIGNSIEVWGAQLEAGANATSYIPTVASAVTRNADVISKTGISDLIGQTEGTMYAEIDINTIETKGILDISADIGNFYRIRTAASGQFLFRYRTGGGAETTIASLSASNSQTGIFKIAFAYKNGDYASCINGVLRTSNISGISPIGSISEVFIGVNPLSLNDRVNSVIIFKERLTNEQCIALTTL